MPKIGHFKHLLVIVDHITHWVEAIPLPEATATNVINLLLENIIPRLGVIENMESDNGSHFIANLLKGLMKALEVKWEHHTPCHPTSSGRVERMNQFLKNQLTKLVLETRLPWTKCLPIPLLRIKTAPWEDIGLSLYEMLYGLSYISSVTDVPSFETKDYFLRNYILGLSFTYFVLGKKDC
jgi:transposase InsO family protein